MIKIEPIKSYPEFLKLKPAWNELLAQSDIDGPFLTFEWLSSWWKAYGQEGEMMIFVVSDDNHLVAMAPLMRRRVRWRGWPSKIVFFISKPDRTYASRAGFIIKGSRTDVFSEVLKFMKGHSYHFDMLHLYVVVKDSLTHRNIVAAIQSHKMKSVEFEGQRSPYIQTPGSWEEYKIHRSRNLKNQLNRLDNLFARQGGFEITKYVDSDIQEALDEMLSVSRKTWKYELGTAMANSEQDTAFYKYLAQEISPRGWLNIWMLKFNGTPVAYIYNILYKNGISSLDIGYDRSYARFSPGEFLMAKAIKDACENGVSTYDLLGTDLPFKMKWTDSCRKHVDFWLFNDTSHGNWLAAMELKLKPVLKRLLSMK